MPHTYRYPKPRKVRLYVCAQHALEEPTAEPLTDQDRAEIAARWARREAQLAPARRGAGRG